MKTDHLSAWEQEEYVLDQRTPQMLRHLTECAECRAAVARLEHGVAFSGVRPWNGARSAWPPVRSNCNLSP